MPRIVAFSASIAVLVITVSNVEAAMGAKTMFERLDSNHDGKLSREEAEAASGKKYDLIASKNKGHVTSIALSGRLSKSALEDIQKANSSETANEPDRVSREQYIGQTDKAFDAANIERNSEGLGLGELSAPSAKDIIDLLQ